MSDTENAIADSIASQYAGVMDDLIADCHHLEDQVAELTRQRDRAMADRDRAIAERDAALEGEIGDDDLRSWASTWARTWARTRAIRPPQADFAHRRAATESCRIARSIACAASCIETELQIDTS